MNLSKLRQPLDVFFSVLTLLLSPSAIPLECLPPVCVLAKPSSKSSGSSPNMFKNSVEFMWSPFLVSEQNQFRGPLRAFKPPDFSGDKSKNHPPIIQQSRNYRKTGGERLIHGFCCNLPVKNSHSFSTLRMWYNAHGRIIWQEFG